MTALSEVSDSLEKVRVRVLPDGRMSAADAAAYLGLDAKTLTNWRVQGKGPAHRKVGSRVFYQLEDLNRFVQGEAA